MTRKIGKIFLALLGDIKLRFFFIQQRHIPLIRLLNIIKFKSFSFCTHHSLDREIKVHMIWMFENIYVRPPKFDN
jgi:hypothetical protein